MEVSAMPPMPLDFSMVRSGASPGEMRENSPRQVSNSAFRVVTPKGKLCDKRSINQSISLFA